MKLAYNPPDFLNFKYNKSKLGCLDTYIFNSYFFNLYGSSLFKLFFARLKTKHFFNRSGYLKDQLPARAAYHSVNLYTTISISWVAFFCIIQTCDPAKIYYNPSVHFKCSKWLDWISHWGFLRGYKQSLCMSSGSRAVPWGTGDPAQAMLSLAEWQSHRVWAWGTAQGSQQWISPAASDQTK